MFRLIAQYVSIAVLFVVLSGCTWSILNADPVLIDNDGLDANLEFDGNAPQAPDAAGGPGAGPPDDGGDLQPPPSDTAGILYAIPQQTSATVGESVRIVVTTSQLDQPFAYMNSVAVTVENGATYVPDSFNHGSVGGSRNAKDGFWDNLTMSGFLGMPDALLVGMEMAVGDSRHRIVFNISPFGGQQITGNEGDLFSFELEFSEPGMYVLGFQGNDNGIERTYFSDAATIAHFWDDITNQHQGIANSITVTE